MTKSQRRRQASELLCWELTKMEVLMRDNFHCRHQGRNCQQIAVDILPIDPHPDLKFEPDNLISACRPCYLAQMEVSDGSE